MQNKKKITPTFSSKKRSHQALIAHPNNENSGNARYQGCFGSSSSNCGPAKQPRHANNNQSQPRQQSFTNTLPRPSWNDNPNNNSAFFQSSFQGNSVPPLPQSPWTVPSPFAPCFDFEGVPPRDPAPRPPQGINSSWQKWSGVNEDQGPMPTRYPTQMMGMPQFGRDFSQQPNNTPDYPTHQQPHFPVGRDPPPPSCWPPHQNCNRPPPTVGPPHQSAPPSLPRLKDKVEGKFSLTNQQGGFSVDDRSTKVMTASIADVKQWSKHTDKTGVLIFEVYGKMTSAMSSDINGLAKKFTLKDQNQTLKCIFYETDRPLVKLTKDQWLRCMGSVDNRSSLFRCVSVRPATPAEQKVMNTLITTSESVMKERLASVQEPSLLTFPEQKFIQDYFRLKRLQ